MRSATDADDLRDTLEEEVAKQQAVEHLRQHRLESAVYGAATLFEDLAQFLEEGKEIDHAAKMMRLRAATLNRVLAKNGRFVKPAA